MPSTGSALTGRSSPRPAIIAAVTLRTNAGALAGTTAGSSRAGGHPAGNLDPVQALQGAVDRGLVALDHLGAAPAVGLGDRGLDLLDRLLARQHARDGEEAGLQDGVGPAGQAGLAGDRAGVDHVQLDPLGEDLLLDRAGQRVPDLIRRQRALSSSVAPGAARSSTSTRSSSPNWWQPTKLACRTR